MFAGLQRRFFAILLVSGVYGMPADTAYANDCLTAPTSSASGESQWLNGVYPGNVLKCWYLRALGQPEQKIVVQDSSTTVPARRSQLVRRPAAPTPKAAPPKTQIPLARDDSTRASLGVAASTIKTHPSALASVTLERSAEENAHSPSIQQSRVRNTDAPEVDEQALGARPPVRFGWPLPVSETPPEAAGTTVAAKNESVQLVRPEAHVETTGQGESSLQPREGTIESLRVTPSTVFLFLAIGLPWVGVLAWLGITANTARGERLARNHLQLKATGHLDYNKRGVDRLDDQREADRMDDFLADVARFLSSEGMKVRSYARGAMSDVASQSPTPKRGNTSEAARVAPPRTTFAQIASVQMVPEQATAADPAFSETPVREHAAAMDFAARWPDLPESPNLSSSELAAISNSYADTQAAADAEEQMPLTWPVTEAGRAGQQQDAAGQAAFGSVFLAGALALGSLSLVDGVFKLARRSRQRYLRDPWRAASGRSGPRRHLRADFRELAGSSSPRHGASVWRVPQPTDPARDLKTSLAELMQDLQRARAANFSPRSFAPPANHTERVAEAFRFKRRRKARTAPFKLSERVASILGVEPSLAVAQAADEGAAR
jgi:hypothetical protein